MIQKNKKGLSDIVITLMIVVLALVAIGGVWAVVNNLLQGQSKAAEDNAKCVGLVVKATKLNCSDAVAGTNQLCSVTLSRAGTNSEPISGVYLFFTSTSNGVSSGVVGSTGEVNPLRATTLDSTLANAGTTPANRVNKVDVQPYFTNSVGKNTTCQPTSYTF
jgi:hypothetical protein